MKRILATLLLLALQQTPTVDRVRELLTEALRLLSPVETPTNLRLVTCDTLKAAIATATKGQSLVLPPGARCVGPIELTGDQGVTLTSGTGPLTSDRMTADLATDLPKILAPKDGPAIVVNSGAANWTVSALEVIANPDSTNNTIGCNGDAHDIVFQRLYVHGDAVRGAKNAIALNCGKAAVLDSTCTDFKKIGQDTQCVVGTQGTGPYVIENNHLQAAGEPVLFGGADPTTPGLIPSNITVRRNQIDQPPEWRGQGFNSKNLFELKNAAHVLVEDNVLEYNWAGAQPGYAVVLTPRNQGKRCPWCTVRDVTFRRNTIRHVSGGFNMQALDDTPNSPTVRMQDIRILDTTFEDLDAKGWGAPGNSNGKAFGVSGVLGLEIRGTRISGPNISAFLAFYGQKTEGLVVADNPLLAEGDYGVSGAGTGQGTAALNAYAPGFTWSNNTVRRTQTVRKIVYPQPGTTIQ